MSTLAPPPPAPGAAPTLGALGRLGRFTAAHARGVVRAWIVLAIALGALAPGVKHALSGAGWEATGSESVAAREQIDRAFGGQGSYDVAVLACRWRS